MATESETDHAALTSSPTFQQFLDQLSLKLDKPLPGLKAQESMLFGPWSSPAAAQKLVELATSPDPLHPPKQSAVLILLYNINDEPHFCLTERNVYDGPFSGDICFPGGKREESDKTLQDTATREAFEEIGIEPNEVEVLSELSVMYSPPVHMVVTPFLGFIRNKPGFKMNAREVANIIEVPVSALLDSSNQKKGLKKKLLDNKTYVVPYYDFSGKFVWGMTACILAEFEAILRS